MRNGSTIMNIFVSRELYYSADAETIEIFQTNAVRASVLCLVCRLRRPRRLVILVILMMC